MKLETGSCDKESDLYKAQISKLEDRHSEIRRRQEIIRSPQETLKFTGEFQTNP